ncbi:MAG: protein kinase [Betaproteobacteria bacterium]|nr:protein kinase [Betaproteobacteria bacterium]
MAKILIIDDDVTTCNLVKAYLTKLQHETHVATDGIKGVITALDNCPDMVLCDIGMPKLDGFGVLAALRNDSRTAKLPFVFLTANEDRENLRRAMRNGAKDYLVKPVTPKDLYEAVDSCLGRRDVPIRAADSRKTKSGETQSRNEGFTKTTMFAGTFSLEVPEGYTRRETRVATVLFSDIRNFTTFSEILKPTEVAEMLHTFFTKACEPILQQDGWVVKMLGDAVLAMFELGEDEEDNHCARGLRAAVLMVLAASNFQAWIDHRFGNRGLPRFAIGAGVHTGEVVICNIDSGEHRGPTIIGDTVNVAARLESMTKELGWSIVASEAVVHAAGGRIEWSKSRITHVRGRTAPMNVMEISGFRPRTESNERALGLYHDIRRAILSNNAAIQAANTSAKSVDADNAQALPEVDGYRVLRKIGEGGMSSVYLGEHIKDGGLQVIKIMPIGNEGNADALQRFIQEYALVSQVNHRNVARIYQQGFTDSNAFIAMEYLSGGDLRENIGSGMAPTVALSYLLQAAAALEAVHSIGIVHRDLKPANLMLRADGSLALVDFGISKIIACDLSATRQGDILGTPYYLSPEQVLCKVVDARSDIYSLGTVFYEMLTGKRPYTADNAQSLLAQHVSAPTPTLPNSLAPLQELLDRMMAKNPDERFASADELRQFAVRAAARFGAVAGEKKRPQASQDFEKTQPLPRAAGSQGSSCRGSV